MKVLKIGAVWCSGCLVMKPRWQEIEKENPWLVTEYFDYDSSREVAEKYKLESGRLPTFIFLNENGEEIDRRHGEVSRDELVELINRYKEM